MVSFLLFFSVGCGVTNYRLYDGAPLPEDEEATLYYDQRNESGPHIMLLCSINGKEGQNAYPIPGGGIKYIYVYNNGWDAGISYEIKMKPGQYRLEFFYYWSNGVTTYYAKETQFVDLEAKAGKKYTATVSITSDNSENHSWHPKIVEMP